MSDVVHDLEQDVLGAALVAGDRVADELATDFALRPEHFGSQKHRHVWEAILRLRDRNEQADQATVSAELNGSVEKAYVYSLASVVPAAGNFREYARQVVRHAELRQIKLAGQLLIQASEGDEQARERAETILNAPRAGHETDTKDAATLGRHFLAALDNPEQPIPFPFPKLNGLMNGGMRRGDVTLMGGVTNFGKSFLVDTTLDFAVGKGYTVHLFDNEMRDYDRTARTVSRMTGIDSGKLTRGNLSLEERHAAEQAAKSLPFGITDCTDWSIADVCREIRRARFDLYAVDILHNFPLRDTAEWSAAALALKRAAHVANRHLIVAVHVRKRGQGETAAVPSLDDIAESGQIKNRPANVIFVHRELNESGKQTNRAWLYVKKNRHGALGKVAVTFQGERARFREAMEEAA